MRRGILVVLGLLFLCSFLNAEDPTGDLKKIQGRWVIKSLEKGGEQAPKGLLNATFSISENKMTMEVSAKDSPDRKGGARHFTVLLDSSKKPKHIDLISLQEPNKDALIQGIYSLSDSELSLCMPDEKAEMRPNEFESPKGSSLMRMVLRRPDKR